MLPVEDWLAKAKALPVGRSDRLYHGRETRPNLVIQNLPTKWVAYCQSCKEGGVVDKEHVRLDVYSPEAKHSDLTLPQDMTSKWDEALTHSICTFLASKGMDLRMLPTLYFSNSRKRLLIQTEHDPGWLGRDTTGSALEKWLTYNKQQLLLTDRGRRVCVVVEDPFSYYKVLWATQEIHEVSVMCALGTGSKLRLVRALLEYHTSLFMFDGDGAGRAGAIIGAKRMRACGCNSHPCCAPFGYDPKDLTAEAIRNLINSRGTDGRA